MQRTTSTVIITSLTAAGVVVLALTTKPLIESSELDTPLNPFGINRSPYGEVFAMALQGPINSNFHVGMYGATDEEIIIRQSENKKEEPGSLLLVKPEPEKAPETQPEWTLSGFMQKMLDDMQRGHVERTNPLPASEALKFYLRGEAEDKLRFAYNLDPSHYANYTSLHFFLNEGISTRPRAAANADELAKQTIEYCLNQEGDTRPALTAAAACTNMIHLMFRARGKSDNPYTLEDMSHYLKKLDESLTRYEEIAREWDENGNWQRISTERFNDCQERYQFTLAIQSAAEKTVARFKKESTH